MMCGCGCWLAMEDKIRRDCYFYHCEHQMGASIDCCTLMTGLGVCPCSEDCKTYISTYEAYKIIEKYVLEGDHVKESGLSFKDAMHEDESNGFGYVCCPKCGAVLSAFHNVHYCGKCGQAVKWK